MELYLLLAMCLVVKLASGFAVELSNKTDSAHSCHSTAFVIVGGILCLLVTSNPKYVTIMYTRLLPEKQSNKPYSYLIYPYSNREIYPTKEPLLQSKRYSTKNTPNRSTFNIY